MLISLLSRRHSASARRQLCAVITSAFILLQPALFAAAQGRKQVIATGQKSGTAKALPNRGAIAAPTDTGAGSVSLTTLGVAATENFNTLSNTAGSTTNTALPTGWYITESGGGARDNEQYAVDTGGSTTGDIYSYGSAASTERALGELRSGTLIPLFGAKFTNNTGATITSLDVSYTGEEWRFGGVHSTVADRLDFQYSVNATDLSTGTYLDANALDFNPPVTAGTAGALDGNAAANRTAISSTITGLSIPNGATFFIRLNDVDATGADDGLAVDDFSITPQAGVVQPTLNVNDVTQAEGNAGTTNFNFTVSLTAPAGTGGVSFTVNTADGTATAPSDYTAIVNGAGSIPEGSSSTQVTVQVNGDITTEPNETFFVNLSSVTGANAGDTQGLGTITNDDVTLTPIYTIQGSGTASPLATQSVTTSGIVTGIKAGSSGGFFIQDPTGDGNPNTSDGVFVFTGSSVPAAAVVGNNVQVSGTVQEFVFSSDPNSPPITEISGTVTVSVLSTGNPLPTPHTLTAAETTAPSGTTNPLDSLEEFEGMRVTVPSLTVVAPTQGTITESSATVASNGVFYGVVTGVARPFREPGVNISDPLPAGAPANVPRFDENPERIRVDSDGQPGTTAIDVAAGMVLSNVTGPLDYSFRTYTILPDATLTPGAQPGSVPAPTPTANELTVASFNMERFFDTVNDPSTSDPILTQAAFDKRLDKASQIIRNVQHLPDVIGVEEMENLSTLQAVAAKINTDQQTATGVNPNYVAYLVEGNDVGGIDVGFLVKESRVTTIDVTQFGKTDTFTNPNTGGQETLNDRPPLVLRATVPRPTGGTFAFTVIVNHLRSLSGIDDDTTPNGTGTEGSRIRAKRRAQAEFLANLIQSRQTADPTERIITVGDMNAFNINDGYVDVIGTVKGTPAPADQVVLASPDLVNPNQTNLIDTLPADQRYSFTFDGNGQVLDHIIVNPAALATFSRIVYARDDADYAVKNYELPNELRISDHDQPIAFFALAAPSLIISEFRFRGPTFSPGQGIDGSLDEYIELYNGSSAPLTVSTTDGSAGWALAYTDGTGAAVTTAAVIPNGTVIPAHGHYLLTNEPGGTTSPKFDSEWFKPLGITPTGGYTLTNYAPSDHSYSSIAGGGTANIPDDGAIAIFQTANSANFSTATRLDAVSLNSSAGTFSTLFREGTNLPSPGANDGQYAFVRKLTTGTPQDTDNNAQDFVFVSTNGGSYGGVQSQLGAPGPEDTIRPIQHNAEIKAQLIEPQAATTAPPNRVRDFTPVTNGAQGTLDFRRRFVNNLSVPVTRLRFRIVDITTLNSPGYSPGGSQADIRAIDGADFPVTTSRGMLTVHGTTVEQPAPLAQPNGGGLNSSVTVAIPGGQLMPGAPIDVHFLIGVQQLGTFRFFINVEALP
ncbi:MAG: Calx-beta domain-containing protein [Pyrinomonadaceae bacterium]